MATLTLTIDRTSLSLSDLLFSGANGTSLGLIDLAEPIMVPRTQYVSGATFLHGNFASASTWEHSAISAVVELKYTTAANLDTAYWALVAALGQFSYEVTITKNGVATTWKADRGGISLASGSLTRTDLERTTEVYRLSIPVHPVPVA